ncbi:tautomerase family protein [Lacibacterium aquatile]|uniref:Tautomerase family protein n=1 Tax=Lacibacterium aquatile TaxID=1168082 RepID=A0ABW5DV94_9PROT
MPFIRTAIRKGTSDAVKEAIVHGIHRALVEAINMPDDELFNLVEEFDDNSFYFSRTFNGHSRSDGVVVVEITLRRGRSDAMKRDLYAAIARNLGQHAAVKPADIFIFMHENDYSDWSVGGGIFAMTLVQQRGNEQLSK